MKINKVLLIQKIEGDKMRYFFELADMPEFIKNNCGYPEKVSRYIAVIEMFNERCVENCLFDVIIENGPIYDYKFNSETDRIAAVDVLLRFIDRMAPVFPVFDGEYRSDIFDEYEKLVEETVRFSYIPSPLMTFGVPFGVTYTGGTVVDIRNYPDNTLFIGRYGQRILKSGDKFYVKCGYLGRDVENLSVPNIKLCWPSNKIDDNISQTYTFIAFKIEQLQDCSGDNLKEHIADSLKSGGVNVDEVCALLNKYSGYFEVYNDILNVFAKQSTNSAKKQTIIKAVTLNVLQQTVLDSVYSMYSDELKEAHEDSEKDESTVLEVKTVFDEHMSMAVRLNVDNKVGYFYSYAVLICDCKEVVHSPIKDQFLGEWELAYDNVMYKAVVCGREL